MPTVINIYVDTDVSGGSGDGTSWASAYSSLYSAVLAYASDISSADLIHHYHCRASAGTAEVLSSQSIDFYDYTGSNICNVIVEGVQEHNGIWNDSIYRLGKELGSPNELIRYDLGNFVSFYNLQIYNNNEHYTNRISLRSSGVGSEDGTTVWNKCILKGPSPSASNPSCFYIYDLTNPGKGFFIHNCLIYNWYIGAYINPISASPIYLYNNTIVDNGSYGIRNYGHDVDYTNNLLFGNGTADFQNSSANSYDYNATETAYCRGTNGVDLAAYTAIQIFEDPSNGNYHLTQGSPVIGQGANLTSLGITVDIDGQDRTSWDIGADEYYYFDTTDNLVADDLLAGNVVLETSTIGQTHALDSVDLTSGVVLLESPSVSQEHSLVASDMATQNTTVGTPSVSQGHNLVASDLATQNTTVGSPSVGQGHDLVASDLATQNTTVGTPSVGQEHSLVASDLATQSTTVGTPTLGETPPLVANDLVTQNSTVGTPTIGQDHDLVASDLATQNTIIETSNIGQNHVLGTDDLTSGVITLGTPTVTENISGLIAESIISGNPELESPVIGQDHVLSSSDLTTEAVLIDSPDFVGISVLSAQDLVTQSIIIDSPDLGQSFNLIADNIDALNIILGIPDFSQDHLFDVVDLTTGSILISDPTLIGGQTFALTANDLTTGLPFVSKYGIWAGPVLNWETTEMARNLPYFLLDEVREEIISESNYSDNELYTFIRKAIMRMAPLLDKGSLTNGSYVYDYTCIVSTSDTEYWEVIKWATIYLVLSHYRNKMIAEGIGTSIGIGSERIDTKSLLLTVKNMIDNAKTILNEKVLAHNMHDKQGKIVDLYASDKLW